MVAVTVAVTVIKAKKLCSILDTCTLVLQNPSLLRYRADLGAVTHKTPITGCTGFIGFGGGDANVIQWGSETF